MIDKVALGSKTAKDGFRNEQFVVDTFNDWRQNKMAQGWLKAMGYKISAISEVHAEKVVGQYKADVQVVINVRIKLKALQDVQNLQVKLVKNPRGFNQIDKRYLASYDALWNIPPKVMDLLRYFVGETKPKYSKTRDRRRMFLDEFSESEQKTIINYFTKNQPMIMNDILKGRGQFASEWMLVIQALQGMELKWVLKPINEVINYYSGEVKISPRGSLNIGGVLMQRKGGDGGRESAKMLQFKINPCELFDM